MKLLLDTHLLLWAADSLERVPVGARALMADMENELLFSVVSIWEVAIKSGLNRPDFQVDARLLRRGLIDNGYVELPISGEHAVEVDTLPLIHRDPFDRLLIAQATVEGFVLLTNDATLERYKGPVRLV
ncbi:type II toxin-antitoxin system VapC family toxin [Acidithiobacillus ferriphilus]|uniref:type II toxin-antitoxin system VapC family toxin n=1 Tax=Acidithiobacillus ferriphilus TaxID=1689834 RepID=UPI001C07487F|nr:type II toxin-antitoxin system VapC family toxin [Acidithiobacillus ferriphilus]MBU2831891.1 type II toxin-antitoxin system VapC family toxin [Acidithiobacillus ferriphilus]